MQSADKATAAAIIYQYRNLVIYDVLSITTANLAIGMSTPTVPFSTYQYSCGYGSKASSCILQDSETEAPVGRI